MQDANYHREYRAKKRAKTLSIESRMARLEELVLPLERTCEDSESGWKHVDVKPVVKESKPCASCRNPNASLVPIGSKSIWLCSVHAALAASV